jgi:threonine/homoserine/homoserine lactone efflux protein
LSQEVAALLPLALGVALSPVPIVAVILMLATPRARTNGPAFAVGWVAGLILVTLVTLVVAGDAHDKDSTSSEVLSWMSLVLGILFLAIAAWQWAVRPKRGVPPTMPKWVAAVDDFSPRGSLGLGGLLSGANPKNLALTLAAAASIAQAELDTDRTAVAGAGFVFVGSLSVAGPVILFLVAPNRAARPLDAVKDFMTAHNTAIIVVLGLLLGARLAGSGIADLAS